MRLKQIVMNTKKYKRHITNKTNFFFKLRIKKKSFVDVNINIIRIAPKFIICIIGFINFVFKF